MTGRQHWRFALPGTVLAILVGGVGGPHCVRLLARAGHVRTVQLRNDGFVCAFAWGITTILPYDDPGTEEGLARLFGSGRIDSASDIQEGGLMPLQDPVFLRSYRMLHDLMRRHGIARKSVM